MKLRIDSGVHAVDLAPYAQYTASPYFTLPAGQEHYGLLAYLSGQLPPGSLVADLGTLQAASAVALATNPDVRVRSYDLSLQPQVVTQCKLPNVEFTEANCLDCVADFADASLIVLDIDPHDGKQERKLCDYLVCHNFRGLLICDDIRLNDAMAIWWSGVGELDQDMPLGYRVVDLTPYGHWSGTGLVVFDPETVDVEVES